MKVGTAHSRLRAAATAGQESHAAHRRPARGGNPAPAGPGRCSRPDSRAGHRTVLRGHERGRGGTVHQPRTALRSRRRHRVRPKGGRVDSAGSRRRLPGDAGGVQDHVADRARRSTRQSGRTGADQLQRFRRDRRRVGHRMAVRPIPHHRAAGLPRLLRRPAVRADRRVSGVPDHRLRHELPLPGLRCRPHRPRQVHRRFGSVRRFRLWVRQPDADPGRASPHPELLRLVPLRRLSGTGRPSRHR